MLNFHHKSSSQTNNYFTFFKLPSLHAATTLLIYILFIRTLARKRRQLIKVPGIDQSGQLYFKELRQQWQSISSKENQ
jgi:hypothetical protein